MQTSNGSAMWHFRWSW